MNLTNFLVTRYTSALTLQVLGNAKGVVAVVISVLCFRNPVTTYSVLGYAITVGGVVLYSQAKKANKRAEAARKLSRGINNSTDVEQPNSPFKVQENKRVVGPFNSAASEAVTSERQSLLKKGSGIQGIDVLGNNALNGVSGVNNLNSGGTGAHNRGLGSSGSDRLFPRGFSSFFEA